MLRAGGVETFESCQGGDGHARPEPTIRFFGNGAAGFHAFAVTNDNGLPVLKLALTYSISDEKLLESPWWEMTFRTMDKTST